VLVVGPDRAHHDLADVHADPRLDRQMTRLAQSCRVALHLVLDSECRVQRSLRMVFVGDRRAENREDSVAGRLHHVAVVAPHRIDHQLDRRINDRARLFRIDVLHQLHRSLDVGK
jgi:hypothetical protein